MVICMFASNYAIAQNCRFGVEVGIINNDAVDNAFSSDYISPSIGGRVEFTPGEYQRGLYLASGLTLIAKGWEKAMVTKGWNGGQGMVSGVVGKPVVGHRYLGTANPVYLELPVRIGYKHRITDKFAIQAELGPWIGVGVFDHSKYYVYNNETSDPETVHASCFNRDNYRRFEIGIGGRVGVEIKGHWQIMLGYDYQLNKLIKGLNNRNQTFGISGAYMF